MKQRKASLILIALFIDFTAHAQSKAEDIIGTWLTGGKEPAKIQIYKSDEKFNGKIIWLKNPTGNGKLKMDVHNPDKSKKSNPIIGMIMLTGFTFDNDGEWKGGEIYDPESGKTYSSYIYLHDKNILKIRGYIGISLLGRTETWNRTN